jgi:hypothetical protein
MAAMSMARLTERRSMIRSMREGVGGTLAAPPAAAAGAGDMTGGCGGLAWVWSAPAQRDRAGDPLAVDVGAVRGAEVLQHDAAVGLGAQQRVAARGLAVGERQLAVGPATDQKAVASDLGGLALLAAVDELELRGHRRRA